MAIPKLTGSFFYEKPLATAQRMAIPKLDKKFILPCVRPHIFPFPYHYWQKKTVE
jgi:hypothetical protein